MLKLASFCLFALAAAATGPQITPPTLAPAAAGDDDSSREAVTRTVKASELADGESRTLGSGEHAVTLSRKGQLVTATHQGKERKKMDLSCSLDENCELSVSELGENRRVLVSLTHTCETEKKGEECEDVQTLVFGADSVNVGEGLSWFLGDDDDAGKRVIVRKMNTDGGGGEKERVIVRELKGIGDGELIVIGEDGKTLAKVIEDEDLQLGGEHAFKVFIGEEDEDCEGDCDHERKVVVFKARPDGVHVVDGHGDEDIDIDVDADHALTWISAGGDGKTLLVCPKGDATLRVDPEEKDGKFLCPKHGIPLEPREPKVIRRKIEKHEHR